MDNQCFSVDYFLFSGFISIHYIHLAENGGLDQEQDALPRIGNKNPGAVLKSQMKSQECRSRIRNPAKIPREWSCHALQTGARLHHKNSIK